MSHGDRTPLSPAAASPGPTRREALRLTAVVGIGAALGGGAALELIERARLHRVAVTRTQLGTAVHVTVVHPDAAAARAMIENAFAEFERLENVFSRYRTGTAVARLNREGVVRDAPPELLHVMGRALHYAEITGGAFDPSVAPLLNLYVSRFARGGAPPADAEIEAARSLVGWRGIGIEGSTIAFARPGMAVTMDAIAKGFVVDRAVARLVGDGAGTVLVEAGGDLSAAGAERDPWKVAIQDPLDVAGSLGTVRLRGEAMGSSGDYVQYFTPDRRYHHIIDPRTGRSPEHSAGTTVRAAAAIDSDAISTATFVLGPADGIAFLDALDGVEGMLVTKTGERHASRGFRGAIA